MLKMVETDTICPGKVRTCLHNVCMGACEHGETASSEKYVFDRFCPILPLCAQNPDLKKALRPSKKIPDHVEAKNFQNYFIFSRPPTEFLAKKRLF